MRFAAKVDANQPAMFTQLRAAGLHVIPLHQLGHGVPDCIVTGYNLRTDRVDALLVEIKTERGKLTPDEAEFHAEYPQGGPLLVARDAGDVLAWFGRL